MKIKQFQIMRVPEVNRTYVYALDEEGDLHIGEIEYGADGFEMQWENNLGRIPDHVAEANNA